jgi:hypothetical protein
MMPRIQSVVYGEVDVTSWNSSSRKQKETSATRIVIIIVTAGIRSHSHIFIYIYMYTYTEDEKDEPTAIDIVNMTISGNSSNELPGTNSGVFHGLVSKFGPHISSGSLKHNFNIMFRMNGQRL